MSDEEQIALDQWREAEAWECARGTYYADEAERISAKHEAYRELVVNDVRPPVVVDRVERCLAELKTVGLEDCPAVIKEYGDERHAEGERAGIERAHEQANNLAWHKPAHRAVMASVKLGAWLSAALDDPSVCDEMKADIKEWFSAGEPMEILGQALSFYQQGEPK